MSRFRELLKEARTRAGLTQKELAEIVDVSDGYICKMETSVLRPPSRGVAENLADTLGLRKKSRRRLEFLLAAEVANEEDMQGFTLVAAGQPVTADAGAFGAGVGLDEMLPRDQHLGLLVEQTRDEFQLTPEKRRLAEQLIVENARLVCQILANEQERG